MDKIFDYCILLLSGLVYVLLAKGFIKLPPQRQIAFDQYSERKKRFLLISAYALISISLTLILWNIFFKRAR